METQRYGHFVLLTCFWLSTTFAHISLFVTGVKPPPPLPAESENSRILDRICSAKKCVSSVFLTFFFCLQKMWLELLILPLNSLTCWCYLRVLVLWSIEGSEWCIFILGETPPSTNPRKARTENTSFQCCHGNARVGSLCTLFDLPNTAYCRL